MPKVASYFFRSQKVQSSQDSFPKLFVIQMDLHIHLLIAINIILWFFIEF